jgi:aspartyl-tRNA(Asn)/glutamyl-tRNA(Gln) amidotransferase subunit B
MDHSSSSLWQPVIGLEIHVELNTKSKLFSSAPNRFGDEPNYNISQVCTGQPGALPVLNKEAVKKAILVGIALNAHVARISTFDRKSYFYPDSPRNFQITQYENPIIQGGFIKALVEGKEKTFKIKEAHLEDDAGTLKHFSSFAGVDYNRAGVALLEIVSEPCMHSAKEASIFAQSLKSILQYLNVADCNMDEGGLRMDVNVSVSMKDETELRNKIEIKNMNSFHNMELAIDAEIERQIEIYLKNPDKDPKEIIRPATFRFDPEFKKTQLMRTKEMADDYRYFPEPDLAPVIISEEWIEGLKKELPELPYEKYHRYVNELNLSPYSSTLLTSDKKLADYFEEGLRHCSNAEALCNWITIEFQGRLKEEGKPLTDVQITPQNVAKLVNMIDKQIITGKIAKSVADDMIELYGKDCELIVKENPNYQPLNDRNTILSIIDAVLLQNPDSLADFKNGKQRAFGFLVGQIMKATNGKACPNIVNEELKKKLL